MDQYFNRQGVDKATQQAFLQEIVNNLDQATEEGWGLEQGMDIDLKDASLIKELKHNNAVFAIFKKHDYDKELVKLLIDEDGALRSKSSFVAEASKLNDKHLKRWFATEYDHAVAAASQARKWQDYQREAHLYPNLKYDAVMDSRTRPVHADWNGMVLPINHPFWDTHYPPNDWGCRCDAYQTDEPINTKGKNLDTIPSLPKIFNNNVGKTGETFKGHKMMDVPEAGAILSNGINLLLSAKRKELIKLVGTKKYSHPELGSIFVNKTGINQIQNKNTNPDALRLLGMVEELQPILNRVRILDGLEPPSKDKAIKNVNILHYRRGIVEIDDREVAVMFEKDKSLTNDQGFDYKFYGMYYMKKSEDS